MERREIQTLAVDGERIGFPFCEQLVLLHRTRDYLKDQTHEEGWLYLLCSRNAQTAAPDQLLRLSRGHWTIESVTHYVRDFTYDEDRRRIRHAPTTRICATLQNLAIWLLGRNRRTRRDTRPRRQKRIARHPGLAVKMVTQAP